MSKMYFANQFVYLKNGGLARIEAVSGDSLYIDGAQYREQDFGKKIFLKREHINKAFASSKEYFCLLEKENAVKRAESLAKNGLRTEFSLEREIHIKADERREEEENKKVAEAAERRERFLIAKKEEEDRERRKAEEARLEIQKKEEARIENERNTTRNLVNALNKEAERKIPQNVREVMNSVIQYDKETLVDVKWLPWIDEPNIIRLDNHYVLYLHDYVPKRYWDEKNIDHIISEKILSYKNGDLTSLNIFTNEIVQEIKWLERHRYDGVRICMEPTPIEERTGKGCYVLVAVPPSKVGKKSSMRESIYNICKWANKYNVFSIPVLNGSYLLERVSDVKTSHLGERASLDDHINSIKFTNPNVFDLNPHFILLDDIFTTGTTLAACENIIKNAAIGSVSLDRMVIGKTLGGQSNSNKFEKMLVDSY